MISSREVVRHPLVARRAQVRAVTRLAPRIVRVTLGGPELDGFAADGPEDHVKLFLPDPATGELHAPTMVDGALQRPTDGVSISRDYTPRAARHEGGATEVDIELVLHGTGSGDALPDDALPDDALPGEQAGPAAAWAASVAVGDEVVIAGPRGSRVVPAGITGLLLVADETAIPAASRWVEAVLGEGEPGQGGIRVDVILDLADESMDAYVDATPLVRASSVERLYRVDAPTDPGAQLLEAVRSFGVPDDGTYVWAAGEAGALVGVRRYLRRELGLGADQVKVDGYWKRGVVNRDHHAPLDPTDPD